jgi:hypothetical protein
VPDNPAMTHLADTAAVSSRTLHFHVFKIFTAAFFPPSRAAKLSFDSDRGNGIYLLLMMSKRYGNGYWFTGNFKPAGKTVS